MTIYMIFLWTTISNNGGVIFNFTPIICLLAIFLFVFYTIVAMYFRNIILRLVVFVIIFSLVFFAIRMFNLLPSDKLTQNIASLPWLFSAISVIFSIISGFVIQSKWHVWDELTDATHGEVSAFRQLHIMAHHFPLDIQLLIHTRIQTYLQLIIAESAMHLYLDTRSINVDNALYQLEDTIFTARKKDPESATMAFTILKEAMDYRERRIQSSAHILPTGVKIYIMTATFLMIFSSLFIGVDTVSYDYLFTLMIGILSYGIYLLIDDLDHPYRPGQWHLKVDAYAELLKEINIA